MRICTFDRYGSPDVLAFAEVPKPVPAAGELLVRIHATSVNRTDCAYLTARPVINRLMVGMIRPRKRVLGNEFAGVVAATGPGDGRFAVGDRVFGVSPSRLATHAEWLIVPASGPVTHIPEGVSMQDAGAIADGAMLSSIALRAVPVIAGHRILILGGAGSMGSAAVQLAKHLGAHVTATCSTTKLETVRQLGADEVIDYTVTDVATLDERFDVVFDAVGKHSYLTLRHLLPESGTFVPSEFGRFGQHIVLLPFKMRSKRRRIAFTPPNPRQAEMDWFRGLVADGAYRPVIDRTYAFDDIVEAYRYVMQGQKTGNVAITMVTEAG